MQRILTAATLIGSMFLVPIAFAHGEKSQAAFQSDDGKSDSDDDSGATCRCKTDARFAKAVDVFTLYDFRISRAESAGTFDIGGKIQLSQNLLRNIEATVSQTGGTIPDAAYVSLRFYREKSQAKSAGEAQPIWAMSSESFHVPIDLKHYGLSMFAAQVALPTGSYFMRVAIIAGCSVFQSLPYPINASKSTATTVSGQFLEISEP